MQYKILNYFKNHQKLLLNCFNDYSSVSSDVKYKTIRREGIRSRLARAAKVSDHWHLKILRPKQIIQRFPIALAQVRVGNTSEKVQMYKSYIISIEQKRYYIKNVDKNIMNSINQSRYIKQMDTIFMNSKNIKTFDSYRLLVFQ